jgi:hypothetical protein
VDRRCQYWAIMACQFARSNQRCAVQGRSPRGRWVSAGGRKKEGTDVAFGIEGEGRECRGIEGAGIARGLPCAALSMAVAAVIAAAAAANAAVAAVVAAGERLRAAERCGVAEGVALRRANSACGTSFASGCRKPEEGAGAPGLDGAVEGEEADEEDKENGVALAEREEKEDDDADDGRRF